MKRQYIKYLDLFLQNKKCNLNCSYCYVEGKNSKICEDSILKYNPKYIAKKCLSYDRLGGYCIINICADGETLLHPDCFALIKLLLEEGHVVSVVSNGTLTDKISELLKLPKDLLSRLFFKFSFHYLELKNRNLLNKFFNNIKLVMDSDASFTIEMGASDDYIPYIKEIEILSMDNFGALPHLTILRDNDNPDVLLTKYSIDEYKKIWSVFNSELFDIRLNFWTGGSHKSFCFAGLFTGCINLMNGSYQQCYLDNPPYITNVLDDVSIAFPSTPIGYTCPAKHCRLCHTFLAFGDKPDIKTPTYTSVRNRVMTDGREWLKETIKDAFNTKFYETNPNYLEVKRCFEKSNSNCNCTAKNKAFSPENIFSVKNSYKSSIKRKVITILGVKIKIKCE